MKKHILYSLFVPFVCAVLSVSAPQAEAASTTITVCGVSSSGSEQGAQENARKKAMFKAMRYLLTPQNPLFRQIMTEYADYTSAAQVFQTKKENGKLMLFSKVDVDMDKLTARINGVNAAQTERHDDNAFYCLIRVHGASNVDNLQSGQSLLGTVYKDVFERLGFQMASQDELNQAISGNQQPFEEFCQGLSLKIDSDHKDVPLAIIGDVNVRPAPNDPSGQTQQSDIVVRAIDIYNGRRVIAEYRDSYQVTREQQNMAGQRALDKAGLNSARALADKVAAYWQKH